MPLAYNGAMFRSPARSPRWAAVIVALVLLVPPLHASAREAVTLQLKWRHAFQFAGYYAAKEKGFYDAAGLDVHLKEATPGMDPVEPVLNGQAQYGVGNSSLLLARRAGQPVVVLAVVFQHSPLVLLTRQQPDTADAQGLQHLAGKRVMIEPHSDELIAYLKREGVPLDQLVQVPHSYRPEDLIEGRVDAITAYASNEPFYLDRAGLAYQSYSPRAAGIDFYGDNLFTTEDELRNHPDRVRAFRDASLRGWHYALEHPTEIADLLHRHYAPQHPRAFFLFEAQRMMPLLRADLIEVGYMNPERWRHIADTYADLGLLPRDYALDGFLYAPDVQLDRSRFYLTLALLALVTGAAMYVVRINRRLSRVLAESQAAEARIRHLAQHDPLTELPNRALLSDRLGQALVAAKRDTRRLAVMFIDVDNFKPINDTLGHAVGDRLLQQIAKRLQASLRESDTVARIGGDEFVVLLRNVTDGPDALAVADKLREVLSVPIVVEAHTLVVGASVGVALYPDHGSDALELFRHADEAMYRAKRDGRNRAQVFEARSDRGQPLAPSQPAASSVGP